jgi:hypothetical protein
MPHYFCFGKFIELIKERDSKVTKLIICFDTRKWGEKTNVNQFQWHPYGIIIVGDQKRILDYSKLIEIYVWETDDGDTNDNYQIVMVLSEGKNKAPNTNKKFHLLDVSSDLKKWITSY